jgi:hypothetical protein
MPDHLSANGPPAGILPSIQDKAMAALPPPAHPTVTAIYAAYEEAADTG